MRISDCTRLVAILRVVVMMMITVVMVVMMCDTEPYDTYVATSCDTNDDEDAADYAM